MVANVDTFVLLKPQPIFKVPPNILYAVLPQGPIRDHALLLAGVSPNPILI